MRRSARLIRYMLTSLLDPHRYADFVEGIRHWKFVPCSSPVVRGALPAAPRFPTAELLRFPVVYGPAAFLLAHSDVGYLVRDLRNLFAPFGGIMFCEGPGPSLFSLGPSRPQVTSWTVSQFAVMHGVVVSRDSRILVMFSTLTVLFVRTTMLSVFRSTTLT